MTSDDLTSVLIVLGTLLTCVCLPIILHHRRAQVQRRGPSAEDQRAVADLLETARRMETRIGYLETVLDTELPGWRSRSEIR
jgi:phage shock protein B